MSQYATLRELIERTDGEEVVQRGLPSLRASYRLAVATVPDLVGSIADPRPDDVALVEADGLLYLYSGESWSAIATPKITQALQDASALADDYLRARYTLPLAGLPRTLVLNVCDIARYYLYDDAATDAVTARYNQALTWLKNVASGTVTLDAAEAAATNTGQGSAHIAGQDRVFSRDSMADF